MPSLQSLREEDESDVGVLVLFSVVVSVPLQATNTQEKQNNKAIADFIVLILIEESKLAFKDRIKQLFA